MPNVTERVFDPLFRRWMASRVRVHVAGMSQAPLDDVPLVYCANHESWWDGFVVRAIHRRLRPKAPFRAVMLEQELRNRSLLRALGGIGLEPGSVSSGRRLLRTLSALPPDSGVAFFPQGRLRPDDPRPLGFKPGLVHVVRALSPALVLPIGIRVLPGRDHRMDAFVSVGTPIPAMDAVPPTVNAMESAVRLELDAIRAFVHRFEEDAADLWPEAAGILPRGPGSAWMAASTPVPFSKN